MSIKQWINQSINQSAVTVQAIKLELDTAGPCVSVWNETARHLLQGIHSVDAARAINWLHHIAVRLRHLNRVCTSHLEQLELAVGDVALQVCILTSPCWLDLLWNVAFRVPHTSWEVLKSYRFFFSFFKAVKSAGEWFGPEKFMKLELNVLENPWI